MYDDKVCKVGSDGFLKCNSPADKFSKLAIASGFKCGECDQFKRIYLGDRMLSDILGAIKPNPRFSEVLLNDFEEHIREKHPDRAKAFLQ